MKSAVFDIHGIRVRMEYRRIKNINLYVRPEQGEALVTVPFRTPRERVERFLYEKEGWMRRHLERTSGNREYPPVDREQIEKMRNKVLEYAGSSCDRMDLAGYEDQMGQLHSEHRAYPAEYQAHFLSRRMPGVCDRA